MYLFSIIINSNKDGYNPIIMKENLLPINECTKVQNPHGNIANKI